MIQALARRYEELGSPGGWMPRKRRPKRYMRRVEFGLAQRPISDDPVYRNSRDHVELRALIQAGIFTPRAFLRREDILSAMKKYDPAKKIWVPARKAGNDAKDEI